MGPSPQRLRNILPRATQYLLESTTQASGASYTEDLTGSLRQHTACRCRRRSSLTAVRYSQPAGRSIARIRPQCSHARANASSATSSARCRLPHRPISDPDRRGWCSSYHPTNLGHAGPPPAIARFKSPQRPSDEPPRQKRLLDAADRRRHRLTSPPHSPRRALHADHRRARPRRGPPTPTPKPATSPSRPAGGSPDRQRVTGITRHLRGHDSHRKRLSAATERRLYPLATLTSSEQNVPPRTPPLPPT